MVSSQILFINFSLKYFHYLLIIICISPWSRIIIICLIIWWTYRSFKVKSVVFMKNCNLINWANFIQQNLHPLVVNLYTKPLISCLQTNSLHKLIKRIIKKERTTKKIVNIFKHCHPYTNGPHVLWMKFYIILWLVELMVGEKNKRVFLFLCFTHFISVKRISVEFSWLFTFLCWVVYLWCDVMLITDNCDKKFLKLR